MFFSSIKELSRLITKGMANIYYSGKLRFSNLQFPRKKFEEMH